MISTKMTKMSVESEYYKLKAKRELRPLTGMLIYPALGVLGSLGGCMASFAAGSLFEPTTMQKNPPLAIELAIAGLGITAATIGAGILRHRRSIAIDARIKELEPQIPPDTEPQSGIWA